MNILINELPGTNISNPCQMYPITMHNEISDLKHSIRDNQ